MSTDPQKGRSIFLEAVEQHTPDQWGHYLDVACGQDQELRRRVEVLLRAHEQANSLLDVPGPALVQTIDEPTIPEGPGTRIGPYKLVEQIGEGGFGVVFLAEQTQPVRRKVALKVLKPGMDSRQVVARFEAERQALALMDHPNIAQIHDGGATPDGRPFFVMELVKGIPITDYCDRCNLTTRERLELLLSVCQAVQHAHQKGVIHRDLKPSNVLVAIVDGKPAVKVIDFGIAKAINQRLSEHTLATGFHQMVGTPLYMSPEQAELSPLDVDTRADIYALGVLLYELLTGTTPLEKERLSKANYDELRRLIREEEPPTPSARLSTLQEKLTAVAAQRRTEPRQLLRIVRGELDWIVMKALEKDRNRRYETANGLAMDVQRYLADEPVLACPPSASYRLRKFVRRNKGRVLAAGLLILVLLAAVAAVVAVQAKANRDLADKNVQLEAANERERQRFDLAMEVVGAFHTGVSEDVLLKQREFEPLRKKLLGGAAEFYGKLQTQLGDAADARSKTALAKAYAGLAKTAADVGSTEQALREYDRARQLYEAMVGATPGEQTPHRDLVEVLDGMAKVYSIRKEHDKSRQVAERAVVVAEEFVAAGPDHPERINLLARALNELGNVNPEPRDEQLPSYRRAAELAERLVAEHAEAPEYRISLAAAVGSLARIAYIMGRYEESLRLNNRVAEVREALRRADPADAKNRRGLGAAYQTAGMALIRLGRFEEALAELRRASQIQEELAAEQPAVIEYQTVLAGTYVYAAYALQSLGRPEEALKASRRQLAVYDLLVSRHPDRPELNNALASALTNAAWFLQGLGRTDEALPMFQRATDLYEALVKAHPADRNYRYNLAANMFQFGRMLEDTGRPVDAIAAYEQARDGFEALAKETPTDEATRLALAQTLLQLGGSLGASGLTADGLAALRRAGELVQQLATEQPNNPTYRAALPEVHLKTALVLRNSGDDAEALVAAERALAIEQQLVVEFPKMVSYRTQLAQILSTIGLAHQGAGRVAQARPALERCRQVCEQLAAEDAKSPHLRDNVGRALANLGYLEFLAGNPSAALPFHQKAVAVREQVIAEAPKNTNFQRGLGYSLTNLGQTYRRLGKRTEAGQALERALALVEPLLKLKTEIALVQVLQLETRLELGMLRLSENKLAEAAGHFSRALQGAASRPEKSLGESVRLAAIHAQLSTLPDAIVAADFAGVPDALKDAKAHADRAMTLLSRTVEKGFANALLLSRSDAYEPLRTRDDFKKLLAKVEAKQATRPEKRP
jgi:serine/threonine protein kinase